MHTRPRPIVSRVYVPVLDWIKVNVVQRAIEVRLIPYLAISLKRYHTLRFPTKPSARFHSRAVLPCSLWVTDETRSKS